MGELKNTTFVCLDCETTGLEPKTDRIIEIAAATFTFSDTLDLFETLVDPQCPIPESSIAIHHITPDMLEGKPKIHEVLPLLFTFVDNYIFVGHGIELDLAFIRAESKRHQIPCPLERTSSIDTLRLARLYGESPTNSLERLRQHFNIEPEGAHRAMSDVTVNISVFKYLAQNFKTTEQIFERLKKPILLKTMPLGKYKGRPFNEIPQEYLEWAIRGDFDMDLRYSIHTELQKRRKGTQFSQASNPFANL
ncbi:MAG: DUF3820 family protein [Verrucomicrobia bacterium]|nr:DUF3820 family protein [Verrucomicrobiota bacterium]